MSPVTVMMWWGGSSCRGGVMGFSPGMADWLRARRIVWRSAADCLFGSVSNFDWTSIMNTELTAENRPAYEDE